MGDTADLRRLALSFLNLSRCAGGRLIVRGYTCSHCNSEEPSVLCRKPVGYTTSRSEDATKKNQSS